MEKEDKKVEQLSSYSAREMRRSLGILNLKNELQNGNEGEKDPEKRVKRVRYDEQEEDQPKLSFSMISYI